MPDSRPSESAPVKPAMEAIQAAFGKFQEEEHVPGLVWAVVKDGQLLQAGGHGVQDLESRAPVGPDSLFRIASMSKAFTALAILRLRDEGRLALDDPAERHLPELAGWEYPTADSPRIRVRDLLSHASGLVYDDPWGDRQQTLSEEDFTRLLAGGMRFSAPPQTRFEYSNTGYAILGRIITNVSGRPFDRYIMEELMAPLDMKDTRYEVGEAPPERHVIGYRWENDVHTREPELGHGAYGAMAGIQTSVNDYARWVAFLLDAWPPRSDAEYGPARRSTVRELAQGLNFPLHFTADREGPDGSYGAHIAHTYGMGLQVMDDSDLGTVLAHGGGYPGYGSFMALLPDRGLGIFAFANRTYATPREPVTEAALILKRAGMAPEQELPIPQPLASAYKAVTAAYDAGHLGPAMDLLAMNFLLDRSAENWARELLRLKDQAGERTGDSPIKANGALSGKFTWPCQRGTLAGSIILAPTRQTGIQALRIKARAGG